MLDTGQQMYQVAASISTPLGKGTHAWKKKAEAVKLEHCSTIVQAYQFPGNEHSETMRDQMRPIHSGFLPRRMSWQLMGPSSVSSN